MPRAATSGLLFRYHSLSKSPDRAMVRTARQSRSGCSDIHRRNMWSTSRLRTVFSSKRLLDGPLSDVSLFKDCSPRVPAGRSLNCDAATRPHQPKLAFTVCISKAYIPFPYLLLSITSVGKAHRLLSELSSEADTILINNDPLPAFGNSN